MQKIDYFNVYCSLEDNKTSMNSVKLLHAGYTLFKDYIWSDRVKELFQNCTSAVLEGFKNFSENMQKVDWDAVDRTRNAYSRPVRESSMTFYAGNGHYKTVNFRG